MLNVYEQISDNKLRSNLVVGGFILFVIFAAYALSYAFNIEGVLPLAIGFSVISSLVSYFAGDKIVLSLNGAKPADRKQHFDFYTATENLAISAGLPKPKIYVIDSPAMNAFATGRDPQNAVVCATTGLIKKLDRTELEGVIAHELSHIKNYDIRLMTMVSVLIGTLSILINMTQHSLYFGGGRDRDDNRSGNALAIIGFIMIIFAPIIAQLIQLAISRRREYLADASSVMMTRQPSGLISALKKLASDRNPQTFASTATAPLYITNPFKGNKLASLFSTHPPLEDRIKKLEEMM